MLLVGYCKDLFIYLPNIIHSPSLLFADGTKIFHHIASHQDYIQLQQDIAALEKWSKLWQLNFNSSKTFVMHLGNNNNPCYLYHVGGIQLASCQGTQEFRHFNGQEFEISQSLM